MKKVVKTLVGLALIGGMVSTAMAASDKLAVVNVAQILQSSSKVKSLNASIRAKFQPEQAKLAAENKSIQADQAKLARNGSVMSADQKSTLETTIKNDREDFVKNASLFQHKLSVARNDAMKNVVNSLNAQIQAVAKADGYSMVFFSQAVAYPGNAVDITSGVQKAFNAAK